MTLVEQVTDELKDLLELVFGIKIDISTPLIRVKRISEAED